MVQGGDPTGTGDGGDSVWGKAFRDEVNGRIRFNHRGQLAMANENRPDTNRAQWFFTLDECRWLDGKHTIFGTVAGDTVFNLLRMGEAEIGEGDRPAEDILLKTVEVLLNPFDNIVPRDMRPAPPEVSARAPALRQPKKDLKLLSFGDEEEEESVIPHKTIPAPSRSIADNKSSDDEDAPASLREAVSSSKRISSKYRAAFDREADADDFAATMKARLKERSKRVKERAARAARSTNAEGDDLDTMVASACAKEQATKLGALKAEAKRASERLDESTLRAAAHKIAHPDNVGELLKPSDRIRRDVKRKKASTKERESDTLAKLYKFTKSLETFKRNPPQGDQGHQESSYHGQLMVSDEDEDDDGNAVDWYAGRLTFKKHTDDLFRTSGDGRDANDYLTVDDRLQRPNGPSPSARSAASEYPTASISRR